MSASIFKIYYSLISVDIATDYVLNGQGIESRWGEDFFRTLPDRCCDLPSLIHNGYGVKRPRHGVDHPHHLAPRLKKE